MTFSAGSLREVVIITSRSTSVDAAGQPSATFGTVATVRASLESMSASEGPWAEGQQTAASHKFTMRSGVAVTARDRLSVKSRTFDVVSVRETDRHGRYLEVLTKEVV